MTNVKRMRGSKKLELELAHFKPPRNIYKDVAKEFFQALDTPVSLSCYLLLENAEHDQLVSKEIDPLHYCNAEDFRLDFSAISLLRKYRGIKTSFNLRERALASFFQSEETCEKTNRRFRDLALDQQFAGSNVWLLNAMTRKIAQILGKYRPEDFFSRGSWGPGASFGLSGKDTSATRKFRYERQVTSSLYQLIKPFLVYEYPNWFPDNRAVENLQRIDTSKLLTVPKNAKIDRTIAIEPGLNIWFQKSLGSSIRERLGRYGYDLNSSAYNEKVAMLSSKDGRAATIDFSSASDTISSLLVREILPPDWYMLLNSCRTPCYTLDKGITRVPFEKFSSMGNGFTFELESLIFVAAAEAVTEFMDCDSSLIAIFGDDVTLDVRCSALYRQFCAFLGFTVNDQKSFSSGCFRESCGTYYFDGIDVKPLFLKEIIHDAKGIFRLANGLNRLAHRYCNNNGRALRFFTLHRGLSELIPRHLRFRGSLLSGDGCLHSNLDEATPDHAKYGLEGFLHRCFVEVPVYLETDSPAVLLARLWYPSKEMAYGNKSALRAVTKTRVKRILVHQWYDFGEWL